MCLYNGPFGCESMRDHLACFAGEKCVSVPSFEPMFGECVGGNECVPQFLVDEYLDAGLGWHLVGDE
jgi:hypothetical protein